MFGSTLLLVFGVDGRLKMVTLYYTLELVEHLVVYGMFRYIPPQNLYTIWRIRLLRYEQTCRWVELYGTRIIIELNNLVLV